MQTKLIPGPSEFSQLIGDHCVWSSNASIRFRCLAARLDWYDNAFGRNENRGRLVGRHPQIGETARRRAIAASTFSRVEEKLVNSLGGETILNDREWRVCNGADAGRSDDDVPTQLSAALSSGICA